MCVCVWGGGGGGVRKRNHNSCEAGPLTPVFHRLDTRLFFESLVYTKCSFSASSTLNTGGPPPLKFSLSSFIMLSLPPGVSSVWIDHRDACACVPCVRVGNRCCFVLCLQVHELILCHIHPVLLHTHSLSVSLSQLLKRLYSRGEIGNEFHSSPE